MDHNRNLFRRIAGLAIVLALALPMSVALAYKETTATASAPQLQTGVTATTTMSMNLRAKPSSNSTVIGWIPGGKTVPVLGRDNAGQWIFVEYNNKRGWIAGWLTQINGDLNSVPVTDATGGPTGGSPTAPPPSGGSVTATAKMTLNVRSGPSTNYAVMGYLPGGKTAPVLGRNGDSTWVFIEYNGLRGWVAAWLCTINGNLASVPVTDASGGTPPPTTPPPPPPGGGVTATAKVTVNLRSGPATTYSVIGYVPAGVTVPVSGRTSDNNWIYVERSGMRGWSAAWLYTINGDLNSVPVTWGGGSPPPTSPPPTAPPSSPPPPPPPSPSGFELGGQVPGYIAHASQMLGAKMTWAKFQIVWRPGMDPNAAASGPIGASHASGMRVLLSIKGPLYPTSIDFGGYVNFVRSVAAMGADGIEVWNEMNLDREWPAGQISPASYVNNMLIPAYQAIKAANPNTLVIAGALAPTGVHNGTTVWADDIYLAGMRDAGAAGYMDCIGVHHNAGATSPDATTGHPADSGNHHYSWYYKPTFNLYSGTFPNNKVCITELGYLSPEGYGPLPPNFWWAFDTTVAEQAQWLARAVTLARSSGRVRLFIVFNVDFTNWGDDPQGGYAIIRPNGTCPACSSLAAAMP